MPYIGRSSNFGVRSVFTYTPSAGDTSVSGGDVDGKVLSFIDGRYAEVYLNGVKLKLGTDYNTDTANTIAGLTALAANDEIEVVVYDSFNVSDTVSATQGGTFAGAVQFDGVVKLDGGINDNLTIKNSSTADNTFPLLTLQTGETDVAVDDVLGAISFQAPDEGTGTDAILVAADIRAISEGDFSSSNNATSLQFLTAASAAVGTGGGRMIFNSSANLLIKDLDTADGSSPTITLQSGDTDIAEDDVLGTINFQAPDEGTGTDAILVAAGIRAVSEGNFSSSNNATKLQFLTGASEAAASKMSLSSGGNLSITGALSIPQANSNTPAILIEAATEPNDFSISGYSDGSGAYYMIGANVYLNSGGNQATWESAEHSAGILLDARSGHGIDFITGTGTGTTSMSIETDGDIVIENTGGTLRTETASGSTNIRIGVDAGDSIVASNAGLDNICIGTNAGTALDSGDSNIAIGANALMTEDDQSNAVAIGAHALEDLNAGADSYTVGIGYYAGSNTADCRHGTFVGGLAAGTGQVTGTGNTAIGYRSGNALSSGYYNTFTGNDAGENTQVGYENVAMGYRALFTNTHGRHVVAIGAQALDVANPSSASSTYQVAVGYAAGLAVSEGSQNTLVGGLAARNLTTANDCVIVGALAGYHASTATQSTFVGSHAAHGVDAAHLTGNNNTAVGYYAGLKLQGAANGNTLMGVNAGDTITTAAGNTCVGLGAGAEITTGDNNIAIGNDSHDSGTTGNNNISIGTSSTPSAVGVENQITLGNSSTGSLRCQIQTIAALSDERDKTDIVDLPYGLDFINKTRPVQYKWDIRDEYINSKLGTPPHQGKVRNGFIAQELLALGNAEQHQLAFNDNPDRLEASYGNLVPMLVKSVQELSTALDAALARIAKLEG